MTHKNFWIHPKAYSLEKKKKKKPASLYLSKIGIANQNMLFSAKRRKVIQSLEKIKEEGRRKGNGERGKKKKTKNETLFFPPKKEKKSFVSLLNFGITNFHLIDFKYIHLNIIP